MIDTDGQKVTLLWKLCQQMLLITQDIVVKIGDKPHILGCDLRKVYIMFLLKKVEKLR